MDKMIIALTLLLLGLGLTAGLSNKLAKDDLHRQRVMDFIDGFPDADTHDLTTRFTNGCLLNRQADELEAVRGYLAALGKPLAQSQPIYSHSSKIHNIHTDTMSDVMLVQVRHERGQVHYTVELAKKDDDYGIETLAIKLPSSLVAKEEASRFLGIDPRVDEEELLLLLADCRAGQPAQPPG